MVRDLLSKVLSFLPPKQAMDTPENFDTKCLFQMPCPNGRSFHKVPGPCSRELLLAELRKDNPRNFDLKRLVQNAFAEHPKSFPELLVSMRR